ncbi:MAG: hypothetical protein Q8S73_02400 [Deltaproteobacteria bacterium]|nr:hypothetical protein [Myxococcales bacterium]MDP3212928.1 hypothetical protein [Deltaproteobacteria bacterium]
MTGNAPETRVGASFVGDPTVAAIGFYGQHLRELLGALPERTARSPSK